MDVGRIAVRVVVAYIYLLVTTRGSGKRVVAQATPFDFVVALIIGDLVDDAIWAEVSLPKFAAGVGSVFFCDALMKFGAQRWDWVLRLASGSPTPVLRDGQEDQDALRGEQLSEADLEHLLRMDGIEDRSEVKLGLVERDHELSVIRKPDAEPAQKKDAARVMEMMS